MNLLELRFGHRSWYTIVPYYIAAGLPQLVEPSFEYPNRKMSPQPLVKAINTIRCPNPRIFGE
jgi:hypothetical protein